MVFVLCGLFSSSPNWGKKWGKNADYKNSRHILFFPRFYERAHKCARAVTEQGVILAPCEIFSDRILFFAPLFSLFCPRKRVFLFVLCLFQKIGLGKFPSVNYFFDFFMRLAILDTPLLLVCGECLSAPHLIAGKDNLLHGRRDRKILCRHVEDTIQHK